MVTKIEVKNLFKIFGRVPQEALRKYHEGESRDKLLKESGDVLAVADVSFSVEEGEIFMVMGLSGSGKSTLVRCLNRLFEPTSGQVMVDGLDINALNREELEKVRRDKISMVFQHFGLFPHRTVQENVEFGLKIRGVDPGLRREKALEALDNVGLAGWGDRHPQDLSGGMQQRVGLARALATDPEILLMDEPFSALDPLIRREVQDDLLELQSRLSKTIVFITHDLSEALKLGDRIAMMKDGEIVQTGTPEDIVNNPANDYVTSFIQDVDRSRVISIGSIMRKPEPLREGKDGFRMAIRRMRELGRSGLYVVNRKNEPVGLVMEGDISAEERERRHDHELTNIMRSEFPTISENASLIDVYRLAAEGLPVAVLSDNGKLEGVVNQFDILVNASLEQDLHAQEDARQGNGQQKEAREETGKPQSPIPGGD